MKQAGLDTAVRSVHGADRNECGRGSGADERLIFAVNGRELSFEKDNITFPEEIIIQRDYNLIDKLSGEKEFLTPWGEGSNTSMPQTD